MENEKMPIDDTGHWDRHQEDIIDSAARGMAAEASKSSLSFNVIFWSKASYC